MDKKVKEKTAKILAGMGLTVSSAVQLYFNQIIKEEALPFRPGRTEKEIADAWKEDIKETLKNGKSYTSSKEMFDDIMNDSEE
jgi:DNA-damage-inducible protein J